MALCMICNKRKGVRSCLKQGGGLICTSCCGMNRSWDDCITTCKGFKAEKKGGPEIFFDMSLKSEETGEIIRFVRNCFLPNVYNYVDCIVDNLNLKFLNSQILEIKTKFFLKSNREIPDEIYLKDGWKKKENWGPFEDQYNFHPLLFVFAGNDSKFFPLKTSINIGLRDLTSFESFAHWNIGLPFSNFDYRKSTSYDPSGRKELSLVPWINNAFSGNNLAIFSEVILNELIELKTYVGYHNLTINQNQSINFPFKMFFPFKNVKLNDIKVIPPVGFKITNPQFTLLKPKKLMRIFNPPISSNTKDKLVYGEDEFFDHRKTKNISDYGLLSIDLSLHNEKMNEALAFVNSFPLPSSVYNSINKLYSEKFAPAIVILSNYSNSPLKATVISEIQNLSNKFEQDVTIDPYGQEEVRITPNLDVNVIKGLHHLMETSLSIKVVSGGDTLLSLNEPIEVLAKDTMVWVIEDPGRSWGIDLSDLVVSWITPQAPTIIDIISKAARNTKNIGYYVDYTSMEETIKSIYDTISEDIRYVNRPFCFGQTENIFIQRIATPTETLVEKSGNCIDLSVLFASCLEACGIDPLIILVPGHAFVGWKGDSSDHFLEATALGLFNFETAKAEGKSKYHENFGKRRKPDTNIIDVKKVREKGIYPPYWFS
jgi:hypothetical protein